MTEQTATDWDESADFVIVGSGGGGLVAALAAAESGLEPLIIEKQSLIGGSTAMSGGMMWVPNNPLMVESALPDSTEEAMAHLDEIVGDVGMASSPARRSAYLTTAPAMVSFLLDCGVRLVPAPGTSDYYPNRTGGKATGRSIGAAPYDVGRLGEWHDRLQPGMSRAIGLTAHANELRYLGYYNRSPKALAIAARVWLRTAVARARRRELVTNGESLVAQTFRCILDRRIPVWTDTAMDDLVIDDHRVVGVRVTRDGATRTIGARLGVLLAAGGFSRNADLRTRYSADQPNDASWTIANPGDTGEAMEAAIGAGAATDLLDEAWWMPSPAPQLAGSTLMMARQRPGAIMVNAHGARFCNEANSPIEVGKAMYANDAVPAWLVFDDGYRRRYAVAKSLPGRLPQRWIDEGLVIRAGSLHELASAIGVASNTLVDNVHRFNDSAARGLDPDFGRGESIQNRYLGDPAHRPNPALGPIDRPPYYATALYPADAGTCGGLITNEHGQVVDGAGQPLAGLYATGNTTATIMGRTYPGQGASIAYTMTFGYIAARHAAGAA